MQSGLLHVPTRRLRAPGGLPGRAGSAAGIRLPATSEALSRAHQLCLLLGPGAGLERHAGGTRQPSGPHPQTSLILSSANLASCNQFLHFCSFSFLKAKEGMVVVLGEVFRAGFPDPVGFSGSGACVQGFWRASSLAGGSILFLGFSEGSVRLPNENPTEPLNLQWRPPLCWL